MKLLKMCLTGVNLFKDNELILDFYAEDRVVDDPSVFELRKPIYTNNILGFAGINASGKTSSLELIRFAMGVLAGMPLSSLGFIKSFNGLLQRDLCLHAIFWHEDTFYYLKSNIELNASTDSFDKPAVVYSEEVLKRYRGDLSKKALESFDTFSVHSDEVLRRSKLDATVLDFLNSDVSIMTSVDRGARQQTLYAYESFNPATFEARSDLMSQALHVFDPSIESIEYDKESKIYLLKFEADDATHLLTAAGLMSILSSGTMKGCDLIYRAIQVLVSGGYLLVDEIENHLNKQLVNVILDMFVAPETNPRGATLVFSTHYPEVLDHVRRKDNIYFFVRGADHSTEVVKYSDRVKRIENKKSEVFFSNYIKGTAPKYAEVATLKDFVKKAVQEVANDKQ